MSESENEKSAPRSNERSDGSETPEVGLVPDEDLPEDLRPEENPLAADPDDDSGPGDGDSGGSGGADEAKVDGMPDMGQPG